MEALSSSFFLHKIIMDHACLSPSFKMSSQNYDFKEIFQLAEQGNRDALLVRNECIEIWGAAVINFIHAYICPVKKLFTSASGFVKQYVVVY